MAFNAGTCYQFAQDLLNGVHNFSSDTFKIALYKQVNATTLDKTTLTTYTTTGEITGTGYVAGGITLSGVSVTLSASTGAVAWSNPTWPASAITADAALIYNASKSNKAIVILAAPQATAAGQTFKVNFAAQMISITV